MNPVTIDELLLMIPEEARESAAKAAAHSGVEGLVVYGDDPDSRTIMAYGPQCRHKALEALLAHYGKHAAAHWCKANPNPHGLPKSRTMTAVDLVILEGMSVHAAARQVQVSPAAVHRAIERRSRKELCPCCDQVVRNGFKINRAVLIQSAED